HRDRRRLVAERATGVEAGDAGGDRPVDVAGLAAVEDVVPQRLRRRSVFLALQERGEAVCRPGDVVPAERFVAEGPGQWYVRPVEGQPILEGVPLLFVEQLGRIEVLQQLLELVVK